MGIAYTGLVYSLQKGDGYSLICIIVFHLELISDFSRILEAMKIYTKTGDKGTTALFGGKRVSKDDIQIEAYGTVDELNSIIGSLISLIDPLEGTRLLKSIQAILFDIGSHLASDGTADKYLPALDNENLSKLEDAMDNMTHQLPELKSFILPGGNQRIAQAHICRTVCRRAERRIISLAQLTNEDTYADIIKYINRLSDYFFVLARYISQHDGIDEVKWNPK